MKTEQLVEIGLDKDQIKQVMKLNGLAVENAKEGVGELNVKIENLQNQIGSYEKQIEELKNSDGAEEKINEITQKYEQDIEEIKSSYDSQLKENKINSTLKFEALKLNPYDVNDVLANINRDELKIEDDKINGIDEVLNSVKESKPYLFKENEPVGTGGSKGNRPKEKTPEEDPFLQGFKSVFKNI